MRLLPAIGTGIGLTAVAAAGGLAGSAMVVTRTGLPVDVNGNVRNQFSAAIEGAGAGALALGGLAAHRFLPSGPLRAIAIGASAVGTTALGSMALGTAFGPHMRFVGRLLATNFFDKPDFNGSRDTTPADHHRVNNSYEPREGDLLPDGVPQKPIGMIYQPGILGGPRLRFGTTVANMGEGPLQLGIRHLGDGGAMQIIENTNTPDKPTLATINGKFIYHEQHRHIHFDDWVGTELRIYKQNADGSAGEPVGKGIKLSFNVTDSDHVAPELDPNEEHRYRHAFNGYNNQGISVGWADTYGPWLQGQSIPAPDLKPGRYVLRQTFDPGDRIAESDETNNVRDTVFTVDDGPLHHITMESSGPPKQ